jgi:hypothetical protein
MFWVIDLPEFIEINTTRKEEKGMFLILLPINQKHSFPRFFTGYNDKLADVRRLQRPGRVMRYLSCINPIRMKKTTQRVKHKTSEFNVYGDCEVPIFLIQDGIPPTFRRLAPDHIQWVITTTKKDNEQT